MRRVSFLIATLACAACGTPNPTGPEPSDRQGVWSWLMSEGGIAPQRYTPESMGYDQTMVFAADSVFEWFRDDSLLVGATYFVVRDSSLSSRELVYLKDIVDSSPLHFLCSLAGDACPMWSIQFVTRDTLILHDLCSDCLNRWYLRTSQP